MKEIVETIFALKNVTVGDDTAQIFLIIGGMVGVLVVVFAIIGVVSGIIIWKTRNRDDLNEDEFYDIFRKKGKIDIAENYQEGEVDEKKQKEIEEKEKKEFLTKHKGKQDKIDKYVVKEEEPTITEITQTKVENIKQQEEGT